MSLQDLTLQVTKQACYIFGNSQSFLGAAGPRTQWVWFRSDVGGAVPGLSGLCNVDANSTQAVATWYIGSVLCTHGWEGAVTADGRTVFRKRCSKSHKKVSRLFTTLVLARLDLLGSHWKPVFSCLSPLPLPQPPSALLFRSPPHCFPPGAKTPLEDWHGGSPCSATAGLHEEGLIACPPSSLPFLGTSLSWSALHLAHLLHGYQARDGYCWTGRESLRQQLSQLMPALLWN